MQLSRTKLFLTTLIVGALYPITQYLVLYNPHYNFLTQLDQSIPLLPWSAWIYILHLPVLFLGPLLIKSDLTFVRVCLSLILSFCVAAVIFAALPSNYPRPPIEYNTAWNNILYIIQAADQPNNTFPSLHVTTVFTIATGIWKDYFDKSMTGRIFSISLYILAGLISLSILTVKQHYIVDLFGGFLLYLLSWKITRSYSINILKD